MNRTNEEDLKDLTNGKTKQTSQKKHLMRETYDKNTKKKIKKQKTIMRHPELESGSQPHYNRVGRLNLTHGPIALNSGYTISIQKIYPHGTPQ